MSENMGKFRPVAGLSGRAKNMGKHSTFHAPSSPAAYPSLRGYRTAETADGPRRRQSVLHMRAQMLQSLFFARCGSIQSCSQPLNSSLLPTPPFENVCTSFSRIHRNFQASRIFWEIRAGIRRILERIWGGFPSNPWPGPSRRPSSGVPGSHHLRILLGGRKN